MPSVKKIFNIQRNPPFLQIKKRCEKPTSNTKQTLTFDESSKRSQELPIQMEAEATRPDSNTDWHAIDIFVFSNGQQYSPPRKYHLRAEDLNLWKSTLSYLAKAHYGPYHSNIDLFSIDGRKIASPLELRNGGSYVAVQPPDNFIDAGYEKYLLKASRSWEKRKAKRNAEDEKSDDSKKLLDMEDIDENVEYNNTKPVEEVLILKSRVSSSSNHDVSTIIKPQLLPVPHRKAGFLPPGKQIEKKRASIQSPLVVRKITPTLSPAPNIKCSSILKRDSVKPTLKITKPEERHSANKPTPRLSKTIRLPSKSKDSSIHSEAILRKGPEASNDVKASSNKVLSTKNDEKLSTDSTDLKHVIEDKELVLVSDLYINPYSEIGSIAVHPMTISSILYEPVRNQATTTVNENPIDETEKTDDRVNIDDEINIPKNNENVNNNETIESISIDHEIIKDKNISTELLTDDHQVNRSIEVNVEESVHVLDSKIKISDPKVIESINIIHDVIQNNGHESIPTEKLKTEDQFNLAIKQNKENINLLDNQIKVNISKVGDNIKTQDSSEKLRSLKLELPDPENKYNNDGNQLEESFNNENPAGINRRRETSEVRKLLSPRSSLVTNGVVHGPYVAEKNEKTYDSSPTETVKSVNDQYKATLKKGDVVNLKLNIEIENHDKNTTKNKENLNSHSGTNIRTDKGSQSNMNDEILAQNKSLISLIITKEFANHHIGDTQRVIIVQHNCCKYCNEYNAPNPPEELQGDKNYIFLLPLEKFEDITERCHCNGTRPEIRVSSLINPVKPTYSCISLKVEADTVPQNILTSATKSPENVVVVSRKKSVAINEESTISRAPSKLIQEVDLKTHLIATSVESVGTIRYPVMKDDSTQTEWCNVVLEARLLSDGHYSFRLPSLEVIKYYKLT